MNPIKLFKLFGQYEKLQSILKAKETPMKKAIQMIHLLATAAAVIGVPTLDEKWLHNPIHAGIFGVLLAISALLHAVAPSIFGVPPQPDNTQADAIKKILGVLIAAGLLCVPIHAQTTETDPSNIYAGGMSYSVGGSPAIAGTGLYAHALNTSGTYAFTAIDALPNTLKPFTVGTNVGAGIAQKIFTLGKVPIYAPTAAGISWNGGNTGWEWNGGVLASIHVRGDYYVLPSVRFLKSSVSGGTGYQPILGCLVAWGK